MATKTLRRLTPVSFTRVTFDDAFWKPRIATNRAATLPIEYEQCRKTGRIDAFKLEWKAGMPNPPHIFWDSDVAKWIEAAAYSLATHPDRKLERLLDDVIGLIAGAQQPDGYLNSHFTAVEPEKRWANLAEWHELYCAGHLMEAAVAYFDATGKRRFLDVMCRYADLISQTFGRGPGQKRGYCGHEEVELALVKLYRATGERRYLDLASYFIDERGQEPNYFKAEAVELKRLGWGPWGWASGDYHYLQAHKPVREQTEVVGHAVRAMYLYSAMADVANELGDRSLIRACERLWQHVHGRRLYVTGGIGSTRQNEGFTFDYDLPNETAYCETCAAVGLVFWNHRMLQLAGDSRYADAIERALYNGTISGVSLDGQRFFYANPLAALPAAAQGAGENVAVERQEWFGCACCPPNIARLVASLGQYVYSESPTTAYVHLYVQGQGALRIGDMPVTIRQQTKYPWDGVIAVDVCPEAVARFTLALRIPGWCRNWKLRVNGKAQAAVPVVKGYAQIVREWQPGDRVELRLAMPVEQVEANPAVRMNAGRVALQRGPVVYCLEEQDNSTGLNDLVLPARGRIQAKFEPRLLGGVVTLAGKAFRREADAWQAGDLYQPGPTPLRPVAFKAVPYCVWCNRKPGEMLVWVRRG